MLPVITQLEIRYATNSVLSANAPDTIVEAVQAKNRW